MRTKKNNHYIRELVSHSAIDKASKLPFRLVAWLAPLLGLAAIKVGRRSKSYLSCAFQSNCYLTASSYVLSHLPVEELKKAGLGTSSKKKAGLVPLQLLLQVGHLLDHLLAKVSSVQPFYPLPIFWSFGLCESFYEICFILVKRLIESRVGGR